MRQLFDIAVSVYIAFFIQINDTFIAQFFEVPPYRLMLSLHKKTTPT